MGEIQADNERFLNGNEWKIPSLAIEGIFILRGCFRAHRELKVDRLPFLRGDRCQRLVSHRFKYGIEKQSTYTMRIAFVFLIPVYLSGGVGCTKKAQDAKSFGYPELLLF